MDEAGFTIVEVVVALAIMLIALPPIASAIDTAMQVSSSAREGVLAADLLAQTMDLVRSQSFNDFSVGTTTTTQTVNAVAFTVTQTVAGIGPPEDSSNVCGVPSNDTDPDDYLLITESITWHGATSEPVIGSTMLAPPASVINSGDGEAIIQVNAADGNPAVGVPVTINTSPVETVDTNSAGCATFLYLNAGQTYTLTAGAGYMDQAQDSPPTVTTTALSATTPWTDYGLVWDKQTTLDPAGTTVQTMCETSVSPATFVSCSSRNIYAVYPTTCMAGTNACEGTAAAATTPIEAMPITFNPGGSAVDRIVTGTDGTNVSPIGTSVYGFPYTTNYKAWAGTCADAQPSGSLTGYLEGLTSVPGSNALIWTGSYGNLTVFSQVVASSDYGATITATHIADADCVSGELYTYTVPTQAWLTSNGYTGGAALAIPVGTSWKLQRTAPTTGTAQTVPEPANLAADLTLTL